MPLRTAPSDEDLRARGDVARRKRAVFLAVPLRGDIGIECAKIVEAGQDLSPCAVRTAAPLGAHMHRRLPRMAVFTRPPDFFLAAVGNGVRRERKIARFVPLFQ